MVTPSSLRSHRRVLLHPLRLAFLEGRHRRLPSDNNGPGQRVLDSFGACPNGRPRGPRQRQVRNNCAIIPSMPSMLQIPTQGNQRGFAQRPAKTTRESKTCLQQPPQTRHRCQTHLLSTVRLLLPRFRGKLLYVVQPYERTAISQKDLHRSVQNVLPRKKLKPTK